MPSSVIAEMRYDTRWRVLTIVFRGSGEVYRYFAVPEAVWKQFLAAPSKGTYLNETFKVMEFRYERGDERESGDGDVPGWVETWPEREGR